ncbi:hypothetical protein RHSIM_Rhsim09G0072500 [Rhododendron simsii]|uniref:Uncharacterized protein n=1 Tax=Rhododendron simsii TaxID=118357 RepID=A0A834GEX4_RHOSS|nr:hypothetical protein RHSIM_Rhsim09G0072500 [Rhododendron simsii]
MKRSLPNNFDLIARSFDDNLLRRLKPLTPPNSPDTPSFNFSLSWLSQAVDFLSATHAEAHALIANLRPSPHDSKSSPSYLDGSLKILDACNSISHEIERLRQRRLLINFVLQLLEFSGDGCRLPASEKLRKAWDLLSDRENKPSRKRRTLIDSKVPEASIGDLVPSRGKISSAGEVIRRAICAVGVVTAFFAGVAAAALSGEDAAAVGVPAEFVWAESLREIGSAVGVPAEVGEVEERVRVLRDVINKGVKVKEDQEGSENVVKELVNAVKEVEAAMGRFSDGLDRLADGVNGTFRRVLCNRNGMLEEYRKGHGSCDEKETQM